MLLAATSSSTCGPDAAKADADGVLPFRRAQPRKWHPPPRGRARRWRASRGIEHFATRWTGSGQASIAKRSARPGTHPILGVDLAPRARRGRPARVRQGRRAGPVLDPAPAVRPRRDATQRVAPRAVTGLAFVVVIDRRTSDILYLQGRDRRATSTRPARRAHASSLLSLMAREPISQRPPSEAHRSRRPSQGECPGDLLRRAHSGRARGGAHARSASGSSPSAAAAGWNPNRSPRFSSSVSLTRSKSCPRPPRPPPLAGAAKDGPRVAAVQQDPRPPPGGIDPLQHHRRRRWRPRTTRSSCARHATKKSSACANEELQSTERGAGDEQGGAAERSTRNS